VAGTKTNERPGTRAVLKHSGVSAYKAREVLNLIRDKDYQRASEILEYCDREVASVIGKLLRSAAANALHNDGLDPEELFVSACFADEGTTLKRWRPRARGRASRIRKRTCHVTIILSRMPDAELNRRRARVAAEAADRRARRVAGARRQGRAAKGETAPPVDEELLEIVAAGDEAEAPDIGAAVEQAIAEDETEETDEQAIGDDETEETDEQAIGDDADEADSSDEEADDTQPPDEPAGESAEQDEEAGSDDQPAGDEETSD
jgi:large subunit ribosomal protein L22